MLVGYNEVRRRVNGGIYEIHLHRNLPPTHTHARTHKQMHTRTLAVVSISSLERDGLRQTEFCPCYIMDNRPNVGFLVHKDIWRKSHRSQTTLSAEGISYNIARQVKLTPDAFGSLRHVRRILQVAAFEKCPQARKKD